MRKYQVVRFMNYNDRLLDLRISLKKKQKDIANILKINRSTYKDYELQTSIIPIKHLVTLSNYFDVSIDYLLGLTNIKQYQNISEVDKVKAGQRLKEFRKEQKLTQVKLASILNTTFSSIAFNEKGRNLIATPFLYTICTKYHISADYLLGKSENPKYLM